MFVEYKWLLVCTVLNNIPTSHQAYLQNKFIGHDFLLKSNRKFNNFDYNFNDWDDNVTQKVVLDYNLDMTLKDDDPELHKYDVETWHPGATSSPIMYVTIPTNFNATKTSPKKTLFVTPTTPITIATNVNLTNNITKEVYVTIPVNNQTNAIIKRANDIETVPTEPTVNAIPKETSPTTTVTENIQTGTPLAIETIPRPVDTNIPTVASINPTTESIPKPDINQNAITESPMNQLAKTIPKPGIVENVPTGAPMKPTEIPSPINGNIPTGIVNQFPVETTPIPTVNNNVASIPMNPAEITINTTTNTLTTPERVLTVSDDILTTTPISITTELVLTFPKIVQVEPELNTFQYMVNTDRGVHYPPDFSYPAFGETRKPNPDLLFTRTFATTPTTVGIMVEEAHHDMEEKKAGYLTTFLMELFKIVATKNKTDASNMFHALEGEVNRLDRMRQLTGFGKSTIASFLTLVRTMNGVPPDVVQSQAALGNYVLANRRLTLSPEVVNLFDLADKIYLKEEGERILAVLQEIEDFPGTLRSADEIAKEMMNAVVINPFKRVYGTPHEKYLVQRLEEYIVKKFFNGLPVQRRLGTQVRRVFKKISRTIRTYTTTKGTTIFIRVIRTRRKYTPPTPSKDTKRSKKTTISNKYAKFSKNRTIQRQFHHRMWRYMDRRQPKVWKSWRSKRTPTITVATTTTRVKRKRKSIYVIKRYVKKRMKKRKVKTTTVDSNDIITGLIDLKYGKDAKVKNRAELKTKVHPKIRNTIKKSNNKKDKRRKLYKDISNETQEDSKTESSSDSISKKTKDLEHSSDSVSKKTKDLEADNSDRLEKSNSLSKKEKYLGTGDSSNSVEKTKDLQIEKAKKARRFKAEYIRDESSLTDEEETLRANLDDAFFHSHQEQAFKSENSQLETHWETEKNRREGVSSYSDVETVLKSKIYKAFGYENDFAQDIKRRRLY